MKLNDYTSKKRVLSVQHAKEFERLHIEYATANNPYRYGDILQDHHQIIKVEEIGFTVNSGICSCRYKGVRLKKNLQPFASGEKVTMWQTNVKNILNK